MSPAGWRESRGVRECRWYLHHRRRVVVRTEHEYLLFEQDALQRLVELNDLLGQKHKLRSYQRFDYDQETGEFVFSDNGVATVVAQFQAVGSFSPSAKTWLWAWANGYALEAACEWILRVREFGLSNGVLKLPETKMVRR